MEILNPYVRLPNLSAEGCNLEQIVKKLCCLGSDWLKPRSQTPKTSKDKCIPENKQKFAVEYVWIASEH